MAALKLIVDSLDGIPEAMQALYTKDGSGKYKLDVDGVEDVTGLKTSLQSERARAKAAEDALKTYEGIDPEEARRMAKLVETNEEVQLIRDGKIDVLRQRWSDNMTRAHQQALKKLTEEKDAEIAKERTKASRWNTRVMDNELRQVAEKVGVHAPAIGDWLREGRDRFKLDDDGNLVQVDKDGKPIAGTPEDLLNSLREEKPHWFPASGNGSGATQNTGPAATGKKTMKRSQFDRLSADERAEAAKTAVIVD